MKAIEKMTTIRRLLDRKGRNVFTVPPDATVYDAINKMAEHDIGALVVTDNNKIVGILTERHYVRNVVLKGRASSATTVQDIWKPISSMPNLSNPSRSAWPS